MRERTRTAFLVTLLVATFLLIAFMAPAFRLTLVAEGYGTATGAEQAVPGMLVMSSMFVWLFFLLSVGSLGGYVYLLLRFKHEAAARYAPPKRVYATPIAKDDELPKVGDNVILLRRSVG